MAVNFQIQKAFNIGGKSFGEARTLAGVGSVVREVSLAAAKVGALTTRTDDDTGTLTMAASHGIVDGDRLDVYWSGGCRRGMTVGTVSVNSVPIDGGVGDVLPADETDITAMVPTEVEFAIDGNEVMALVGYSEAKGIIVIAESNDTEIRAIVTYLSAAAHARYQGDGIVAGRPLAYAAIAKAFMSHGDSTATRIVRVGAALDVEVTTTSTTTTTTTTT